MHFHMEIEKLYLSIKSKKLVLRLEILHKNPPHSYPILGNFVYMYLKELTAIGDI